MRQAQLEISSAEFTEWMAYYELEPFGELVADQRHGVASALLANINRSSKDRPEPYSSTDFIQWGDVGGTPEESEPVLLADPVAHGQLMRAALFGKRPSS